MKYMFYILIYFGLLFAGQHVYKHYSVKAGIVVGLLTGLLSAYHIFAFAAKKLDENKKPIVVYRTIPVYNDDRWPFWHSIRWVHADAWGYKMSYSYDRYSKGDKQRALNEIYATINTKYYEQIQQNDEAGAGE